MRRLRRHHQFRHRRRAASPISLPGDWVVASGVVTAHKRYPTHSDWSQRLVEAIGHAVHADIVGVDAPVTKPSAKCSLREATSAVAVDMESHIAAAAAEDHSLPFAACRVIIDPAHRPLPPAALVNLRADGTPDIVEVLRSVMREPRQMPALLRVAADARAALLALRSGRRRLGVGLELSGFRAEWEAHKAVSSSKKKLKTPQPVGNGGGPACPIGSPHPPTQFSKL